MTDKASKTKLRERRTGRVIEVNKDQLVDMALNGDLKYPDPRYEYVYD